MKRLFTAFLLATAMLAVVLPWPGRARAQCDAPENMVYGMNIDPWNPAGNPTAAELQTVGVRWVRIEWKVGAGFAFFDPIIADLRANGISVLLLVDYASVPGGPGSGASGPAWDSYIATFVADVGGIAAHYGDTVDAWEVWNEPDLLFPGQSYDPGVPADKYGVMLRDTYNAIGAHSSRPVIVGGLASGNPQYLTDAINAVGSLYADGVGVHPYGQRAPDDWPNTSWGFGNLSTFYNTYLQFGAPLWVTELGTVDTVNQAQYVTNIYNLTRSQYLTSVPVLLWFCWSDGMVSPHGILDGGGAPKASYTAYQASAPPWDPACGGGTVTDVDGDGHSPPADCDDGNPNVHPGAAEICGNGVDEDCSGSDLACGGNLVTFWYDPPAPHALQLVTIVVTGGVGYTNIGLQVTGPGGGLLPTLVGIDGSCVGDPALDCHWTYELAFPQAGTYALTFVADPSATVYGTDSIVVTDAPVTDADGDGYEVPADCNDGDANVHPGAAEICGNNVDEDCDGSDQSCVSDGDGDGYAPPHDCDDSNAEVHPGAADVCGDGIDQDCNGVDLACEGPDAGGMDGGGVQPDAGGTDGGTVNPGVSGGCACQGGASTGWRAPGPWALALWLLMLWRRRRRSAQ